MTQRWVPLLVQALTSMVMRVTTSSITDSREFLPFYLDIGVFMCPGRFCFITLSYTVIITISLTGGWTIWRASIELKDLKLPLWGKRAITHPLRPPFLSQLPRRHGYEGTRSNQKVGCPSKVRLKSIFPFSVFLSSQAQISYLWGL